MARIRSIKPEFPQSESMGRVSRDARLLFIQTWTLSDDSGRLRGNSRMLASLLFPYDDDAPHLIDEWITELEREGCLVRYFANGQTYIELCNWLIHQKIDKPSPSKIPSFAESSRILANIRERSSLDQGRDQGREKESPSTFPTLQSSDDNDEPRCGCSAKADDSTPEPTVVSNPEPEAEPGAEHPDEPVAKKSRPVSFATFVARCQESGEKLISDYRPVIEYAEAAGLQEELINLCWAEFKRRYGPGGPHASKRYIDWRQTFRNCVEGNWYRLWFAKDGGYELTTAGIQAKAVTGYREAA